MDLSSSPKVVSMLSYSPAGTDGTDVTDFPVYRHTRARTRARISVNQFFGNIRPIRPIRPTWALMRGNNHRLRSLSGRNFNSCAQKKTCPIGYSAPSRDVMTTPPGGAEQVGTHRSETGWAQNLSRNQIGLSGLPMWRGSRGALVTSSRSHGNRHGSTRRLNRNMNSIDRDTGGPARGAMARCRARAGNRGHPSIATLIQDFSSGPFARACARRRARRAA